MSKKAKSFKLKVPFMEYNWYKEITTNEVPNIKVIEDQIESFLFAVKNQQYIKMSYLKEELQLFIKLLFGKALITKLTKEYQEKFLEINRFVKRYFNTSPRIYNLSRR